MYELYITDVWNKNNNLLWSICVANIKPLWYLHTSSITIKMHIGIDDKGQ